MKDSARVERPVNLTDAEIVAVLLTRHIPYEDIQISDDFIRIEYPYHPSGGARDTEFDNIIKGASAAKAAASTEVSKESDEEYLPQRCKDYVAKAVLAEFQENQKLKAKIAALQAELAIAKENAWKIEEFHQIGRYIASKDPEGSFGRSTFDLVKERVEGLENTIANTEMLLANLDTERLARTKALEKELESYKKRESKEKQERTRSVLAIAAINERGAYKKCEDCNGSGYEAHTMYSGSIPCKTCDGTGEVKN